MEEKAGEPSLTQGWGGSCRLLSWPRRAPRTRSPAQPEGALAEKGVIQRLLQKQRF